MHILCTSLGVSKQYQRNISIQTEQTATYTHTIGDHRFNGLLGFSTLVTNWENLTGGGQGVDTTFSKNPDTPIALLFPTDGRNLFIVRRALDRLVCHTPHPAGWPICGLVLHAGPRAEGTGRLVVETLASPQGMASAIRSVTFRQFFELLPLRRGRFGALT